MDKDSFSTRCFSAEMNSACKNVLYWLLAHTTASAGMAYMAMFSNAPPMKIDDASSPSLWLFDVSNTAIWKRSKEARSEGNELTATGRAVHEPQRNAAEQQAGEAVRETKKPNKTYKYLHH